MSDGSQTFSMSRFDKTLLSSDKYISKISRVRNPSGCNWDPRAEVIYSECKREKGKAPPSIPCQLLRLGSALVCLPIASFFLTRPNKWWHLSQRILRIPPQQRKSPPPAHSPPPPPPLILPPDTRFFSPGNSKVDASYFSLFGDLCLTNVINRRTFGVALFRIPVVIYRTLYLDFFFLESALSFNK